MPQTAEDLLNFLQSGQVAGVNPELGTPDYASLLGYGAAPTPVPEAAPTPELAVPASPAAQPPPSPISVGAGAKIGVQSYSPAANAAIQAGPRRGIDKGIAADRAAVESEFTPLQQQLGEATRQAVDAELSQSNIESQKLAATAESKTKIAAANQDFLNKEQAAHENARAEADAAQSQYRTALLEYQAAKVNPSQLWEQAGKLGQFEMMVTAFVHDFLGAKGIETSGMKSINQAIQNNISAQLENMRKKQDVAQGFKQLWDMQRAQSASDAEARVRMNGFYLSSLTNAIDAKLGAFDSDLAKAKGQAAKARLLQEQVKNDLLFRQHIDESANKRVENRVRMYTAELGASSAKYTADAHVKAAEIAAGRKAAPALLIDTSKSGTNTAIRQFLPHVPQEKAVELQTNYSKSMNTVENIHHLIDLQQEIGRVPPTDIAAINKLQSEAARVAEAVRNLVKMGLVYDASGKQINETEMKIYDQIVSRKDWWTNGDNVRQFGTLAKLLEEKNDAIIGGLTVELQPGQAGYGQTTGAKMGDPASHALSQARAEEGGGKPVDTQSDVYQGWANAPNALKAYDVNELSDREKPQIQKAWGEFKQANPWAVPQDERDLQRRSDGVLDTVARDVENPDRAFIQIDRLAELALSGDKKAKTTLDQFASGHPSTADAEGLLAAYAQWEKAVKGL